MIAEQIKAVSNPLAFMPYHGPSGFMVRESLLRESELVWFATHAASDIWTDVVVYVRARRAS